MTIYGRRVKASFYSGKEYKKKVKKVEKIKK